MKICARTNTHLKKQNKTKTSKQAHAIQTGLMQTETVYVYTHIYIKKTTGNRGSAIRLIDR